MSSVPGEVPLLAGLELRDVGAQIVVAEFDTFGTTSGAATVHEEGKISLGRDLCGPVS